MCRFSSGCFSVTNCSLELVTCWGLGGFQLVAFRGWSEEGTALLMGAQSPGGLHGALSSRSLSALLLFPEDEGTLTSVAVESPGLCPCALLLFRDDDGVLVSKGLLFFDGALVSNK